MPKFWNWIRFCFGTYRVNIFVNLLYVIFGSLIFWLIFRVPKKQNPFVFLKIFLIIAISIYLLKNFQTQAEKLHLLEYGFLSFLIYRALRFDYKQKSLYINTIIIALVIGAIDELLQSIIPTRVYEMRDALANWLSSCLGLWVVGILKDFE